MRRIDIVRPYLVRAAMIPMEIVVFPTPLWVPAISIPFVICWILLPLKYIKAINPAVLSAL
jgi:hypothetical protein